MKTPTPVQTPLVANSNIFSPPQLMDNYVELGVSKAGSAALRLLLLSLMAGMFIAFGGVVSNTAIHAIENAGIAKLVSGAVWPIGLGIVMLLGGELFLGNTMMVVSLWAGRIQLSGMLRQ